MLGYTANLPIQLVQDYNIPFTVAKHLTNNYGGRAHEVCRIVLEDDSGTDGDERTPFFSSPSPRPVVCQLLVPGYPYLTSEVLCIVDAIWVLNAG